MGTSRLPASPVTPGLGRAEKMFPTASQICETKAHTRTGIGSHTGPIEASSGVSSKESGMSHLAKVLWRNDEGQDIAEYAVMLAVILVIVIGTIKLIGTNANNVFSQVASSVAAG
jgi:Flp pilus assembly pilin Flp